VNQEPCRDDHFGETVSTQSSATEKVDIDHNLVIHQILFAPSQLSGDNVSKEDMMMSIDILASERTSDSKAVVAKPIARSFSDKSTSASSAIEVEQDMLFLDEESYRLFSNIEKSLPNRITDDDMEQLGEILGGHNCTKSNTNCVASPDRESESFDVYSNGDETSDSYGRVDLVTKMKHLMYKVFGVEGAPVERLFTPEEMENIINALSCKPELYKCIVSKPFKEGLARRVLYSEDEDTAFSIGKTLAYASSVME
jgi:hypothetical protein